MRAGQRDIGRLQVAMDDPLLVRGFEGFGHLSGNRERVIGHRPTRDLPVEALAVYEFEDEYLRAVGSLETVDLCNVWMIEGCYDERFAAEGRPALAVVRATGGRGLQRATAPELGGGGAIASPHPPPAESGDDLVDADARADSQAHERQPRKCPQRF